MSEKFESIDERSQRIIDLRKQNKSYKEIAQIVGVATQVVYTTLFKAGLTKSTGARRPGGRMTPEMRQRIIDLKNQGKVYLAIADEVGVSSQVVYKVLKEAGLTTSRSNSEPASQSSDDYDGEPSESWRGFDIDSDVER